MVNSTLVVAAVLSFACGAVHSWLGERWLIGPLVAPAHRRGILEKSALARQTLRFAWHITTLAWWGMGATLMALAYRPLNGTGLVVLGIIATTFLATGIIALATSRGRHLSWPVFLAIAGLSALPLL